MSDRPAVPKNRAAKSTGDKKPAKKPVKQAVRIASERRGAKSESSQKSAPAKKGAPTKKGVSAQKSPPASAKDIASPSAPASASPSAPASASPSAPASASPSAEVGPDRAERIAKVLARAGVASRREVERMIEAGRVSVNGRKLQTPAFTVSIRDVIQVDGKTVGEAEPLRLWRYYKPKGLVTTERDEQGRPTIFEHLPPGLPRVLSVGRLDIASEGLLLLTNDGELKRRLELPSTGWLRRYKVRVHGRPTARTLAPLEKGMVVEGVKYQPMLVAIDPAPPGREGGGGANAWLSVGLREGKNREVRRAMEAVGLTVNRLIRIAYGPFRLGELPEGGVEEVRAKTLREQLGVVVETPAAQAKKQRRKRSAESAAEDNDQQDG